MQNVENPRFVSEKFLYSINMDFKIMRILCIIFITLNISIWHAGYKGTQIVQMGY